MSTLRKLLFFFLALVILGAGGCSQTEISEQKQPTIQTLLQSAEQGDARAQFHLGSLYRKGEGVPRDYQESFKWFQMAAGQGDAEAQFNLGYMYAKGQGVPRNYVLAHVWMNLSLSQQTDEAMIKAKARALDKLESRMTRTEISEAQKLAWEFKPTARF